MTANTGNLLVVNVADPKKMSVITSLNFPGTNLLLNVAVHGNRALVAGVAGTQSNVFNPNATGVANNLTSTLLDVSNPDNPQVLGATLVTNEQFPLNEAGAKTDVVDLGNGDFAISDTDANGNPALLVVDPSDPNDMIVAATQVPSGVHGITVSGSELYATTSSGLSVYNIGQLVSDPVAITVNLPAGAAANIVPGSYNFPPTQVNTSSGGDSLVWDRHFASGNTTFTFSWQTTLSHVQAGQTIPVTTGATAAFQTLGTPGTTSLPGTSVTGVSIVAVTPSSQTAPPGGTATFDVRLTNPTNAQITYFESVTNFSGGAQVNLPFSVTVPAQGSVDVPLTFTPFATDQPGSFPFTVSVNAGQDAASGTATATLVIAGTPVVQPDTTAHGVVATLTPAQAHAGQGTPARYVVQVTNTGSAQDTFTLSATGLPPGIDAAFGQSFVTLQPGASNFLDVHLSLTPAAGTAPGPVPLTVTATSASAPTVTGSAAGTVVVVANGVSVSLDSSSGAPGGTFQMTVTNTGSVTDTFNLSLGGAVALVASLARSQVTLAPGASQTIAITTGAITFALPGPLDLAAIATSQADPAVLAAASARLTVPTLQGLTAQLSPSVQVLPIPGTTSFLVLVQNTGNTEDSYMAMITGTTGPVTASLVGLDGQPTQIISLFRLPALSSGALVLNTVLMSAGQGTITIKVQSLSNPAMSVTLTATATATSESTPPGGDGPIVTAVQRFGFHARPTTLVLTFNTALDPAHARNPAAYQIITLGGHGRGGKRVGRRIAVLRAVYDPSAHTVTLHPAERLDVHNRYALIVSGTGPIGLIDTSGRLLDGKHTGMSGSDYTTVISFDTLAHFPAGHARTSSHPVREPAGIPGGPAAAFRMIRDSWATGPELTSWFKTTVVPQASAPGHPIAASRRAVKAHR